VSLYGQFFAAIYDRLTAGSEKAGLAALRRQLLEGVSGRVLEIGGGTGANLSHYANAVEDLVITEPEEPMARRLERKLANSAVKATIVRAPAERLPFEDASFDVVVSTLVLCTVADPAQALKEIHRVLRPGGKLAFLEHVRADEEPSFARWQDRLNGVQNRIGHGCNANRRTLENIRMAGFTIERIERDQLKKVPPMIRPLIVGSAQRA
jgi:ubiquinone/menaquinone biosynthesis C-methylase UbiE